MASNLKAGGNDLDSLFKGRNGATPVSNTGYKVGGTDIANRYYPSAGSWDRIAANTGYKVGGVDLKNIFRDISYPPEVSLSGPADVFIGSYGDQWDFGASSSGADLTQVRFQVDGHGSGAWFGVSGGGYSGFAIWSDPFASPSISHTPGTYLFYFEAEDGDGLVGRAELYVTVH